jgi:hypothetical protein
VFLLLKLLFLPIWLPLKLIGELIEHSGRSHRSHRTTGVQRRSNAGGCLAVAAVVVVLAGIGAIADACGSSAPPAGQTPPAAFTPAASVSLTPSPSTASHHARHLPRRHRHHHHHAAAVPVATQSAAPTPSCYPLSNEGTCYEPGEFCRLSDAGTTGVAGDGERIKCEDNNGWRWEPI